MSADVVNIDDARRARQLRREGIAAIAVGALLGLAIWFYRHREGAAA